MKVRVEHDDRFVLEASRHELNMLQRAIQRSPYDEVHEMYLAIIRAFLAADSDPERRSA